MPAPSFMLRQLSKPSGLLGRVVARGLNRRNAFQNREAIEAIDPGAFSKVLDIGFGGGVSFPLLLELCSEGLVAGVDISEDMVKRAKRRWRTDIESGRMEIRHNSVEALPWEDGVFHGVLTVNTVYFWPDLQAGLREVLRVLQPGAPFVASCVSPEMLESLGFPRMGFRAASLEHYAEALEEAGFEEVCITGARPDKAKLVQGRRPGPRGR